MAYVKYRPMFVMARHCKYRHIFNTGHIGENANYTIFGYDKVGFY